MTDQTLPMARPGSPWLRWALPAGLVIALALALFFLPLGDYLQTLLQTTQGLGFWGYLVVIVAYVAAAVFFVPGSLLTLAAGFLFGVLAGSVVVSIGSTLGAAAAFLAGRYLARGRIQKRIAGNQKFHAIDRAVGQQGFKIVLLTRLTPIFPYNLLNYAFGLTGVSFRHYILASWIGMIPATVLYVYLGSTAHNLAQVFSGDVEGGMAQQLIKLLGLMATVVVTIIITRIARRSLKESVPRHNDKEMLQ